MKPDGAACTNNNQCLGNTCCTETGVCGVPGCSCTFVCETCSVTHEGITYQTILANDGKCWFRSNLGTNIIGAAGWFYQWGRPTDGHQIGGSLTTSALSQADVPGHSKFIINNTSPYDWRIPQNNNLWGSAGGYINNPCPNHWHVPTQTEWVTVLSAEGIINNDSALNSNLILPAVGYRLPGNGVYYNTPAQCHYWSSTINGTKAYHAYISNSSGVSAYDRLTGLPVRCIRN